MAITLQEMLPMAFQTHGDHIACRSIAFTLDYRDTMALIVVLFYSTTFLCACWLISQHGWRASYETWFVLTTFSISQIAYGSLQLATMSYPDSTGLRMAAATFVVGGLAALVFCALGLLHRLLDVLKSHRRTPWLSLKHLRTLEAIITAGFICASIGYSGLTAEDIESNIHHPATTKAAAILYIIGVVGVFCSVGALVPHLRGLGREDRITLWTLLATQPLVVVRMTDFSLDILGEIQRFSAINGIVTAFLCMGILVEAAVVVAYMSVGFVLRGVSVGVWEGAEELREMPKEDDRTKWTRNA